MASSTGSPASYHRRPPPPRAAGPKPSGWPTPEAPGGCRRNPTRFELVDRIEELIAEYTAGSLNSDEYLRRLVSLSHDLSAEERRAVVEDMTEEELAVFDLLTKPVPILDDAQREVVKTGAKRLLAHVHDKLVLDWRRKVATASEVRTTIRDVLDADLPADPYPPELIDAKVQAAFDHMVSAYGDDGSSVYTGDEAAGAAVQGSAVAVLTEPDFETTHLTTAVGHAAVMRSRARIAVHDGREICRLDVAPSMRPVWARTSKEDRVFFLRMNNSTRPLPDTELDAYIADRWSDRPSA